MLSLATLEMFAELLDGVQLAAKHPDFETAAARITLAKRELGQAIPVARQLAETAKALAAAELVKRDRRSRRTKAEAGAATSNGNGARK